MNQRPSRVPSPSDHSAQSYHTTVAEPQRDADASFTEVERPNNLPAERPQASRQQHVYAPTPAPERERATLPTTGFAALAAGIAGVMAEIKPVAKEGWNDFHKYNYARMQDLMGELTPLMGKHGIVVFQNEMDRDMFDEGRAMAVRYEFTIVHKSGEIWPERPIITGVSMCRTSNGKYDDKAFNKCHTSARKYFLLSLFQIPTDDAEDADNGGGGEQQQGQRPRPQGQRRPVPSPDGKVPPHRVEIVDQETPQSWAARFGEFVSKATSKAEIDKWYDANAVIFEKLKANHPRIYDDAIDFMDACEAKLAGLANAGMSKKDDPISTGKPAGDGGFPGDTKMVTKAAPDESIPIMLDRQLTPAEQDWLKACDDTFAQCTNAAELAAEQESVMLPSKDSVSEYAWKRAVALTQRHLNRVQGK